MAASVGKSIQRDVPIYDLRTSIVKCGGSEAERSLYGFANDQNLGSCLIMHLIIGEASQVTKDYLGRYVEV